MTKRIPLERLRQLSMARYARKPRQLSDSIEADRYVELLHQSQGDLSPSSADE